MLTNKQMIIEVNLPYGQAEFKVDPDLRSIRITPFDQQFESRNHNFYFTFNCQLYWKESNNEEEENTENGPY